MGKTVVITGANSGIGKETAREISRMGARVVMVCRSLERGEAARQEIFDETKVPLDLLIADMSNLKSVQNLSQELMTKYPRIDVLLHNAGTFFDRRVDSVDGIEMTLATNHVGVFHLTNLMLSHLKKSAPARIIIVSSEAHLNAKVNINDLEFKKSGFILLQAYSQSKLLNLLYMRELEKKLAGTGVTVNCVHPGVVATNIVKANSGPLLKFVFSAVSPFILSPKKGARTSIKVATDPALEKVTGKYFEKEKVSKYNKLADDNGLAQKVWEVTEALIQSKGYT